MLTKLPKSATARLLMQSALSAAAADNLIESRYWRSVLNDLILKSIKTVRAEKHLIEALDALWDSESEDEACEVLMTCVEDLVQGEDGKLWFAVPVLLCNEHESKTIPWEISKAVLADISQCLSNFAFCPEINIKVCDLVVPAETLPMGYAEAYGYAQSLWHSKKIAARPLSAKFHTPEAPYFSDIRWILGVAEMPAVPQALFVWNQLGHSAEQAIAYKNAFVEAFQTAIKPLFTGLRYDCLLPNAYFAAVRNAELAMRPFSLLCGLQATCTTLQKPPASLHAVMGGVYRDQEIVEYRVSLMNPHSNVVLFGVTWPLLSDEDDPYEAQTEIVNTLATAGLLNITVLDERLPPEYCDDCGVPYYPDTEADMQHPSSAEHEAGIKKRVMH